MKNGIVVDHVSFAYSKNIPVLDDVSFSIAKGEFLGITGVNGSGKSTLLFLFNGLIPQSMKGNLKGKVSVDGDLTKNHPVSFFAQKVGMMFQNPDFSLFNLSVREEIEFGLKNLKHTYNKSNIVDALHTVGLDTYIDRDPQTLSFGEKQKVCLACVLALDVDYIVLDEPGSMLDYKSCMQLYALLQTLHHKGKTIIVVEHDTDFIRQYCQKTLIINNGKIVKSGDTKTVFEDTKILQNLGIKVPYKL
jgi:energy-coupling factor transporter ATP-binding protein EcfA2